MRADQVEAFQQALAGISCAIVGEVVASDRLEIIGLPQSVESVGGDTTEERAPLVVHAELAVLKEAWQKPLRF